MVLITAHSSIESAVAAMKEGAYHYIKKPFEEDEILALAEKALETTRLRREVKALRAAQPGSASLAAIVGDSPPMRSLKALIEKIAVSPASTVLLTGESGTGKDLAARVIHAASDRAGALFMNITCSAVPATLLESELFGHERGAFTDAKRQKKGLFELADRGTVFLDEIGEMAPALQSKLLRFLEEKAFRRVGGTTDLRVDVRVVAATNRDLAEAVKAGQFREDLFYRLNVLPVHMPPLRERGDDIELLARYFVESFSHEFGKSVRTISRAALDLFASHRWPGNVRELKNAIERAVLLADSDTLSPEDFQMLRARDAVRPGMRLPPSGIDFEQLERDLVVQALQRAGGNQTRAAALLGMNRDQIRYRIEKFKLTPAEIGPSPGEPH